MTERPSNSSTEQTDGDARTPRRTRRGSDTSPIAIIRALSSCNRHRTMRPTPHFGSGTPYGSQTRAQSDLSGVAGRQLRGNRSRCVARGRPLLRRPFPELPSRMDAVPADDRPFGATKAASGLEAASIAVDGSRHATKMRGASNAGSVRTHCGNANRGGSHLQRATLCRRWLHAAFGHPIQDRVVRRGDGRGILDRMAATECAWRRAGVAPRRCRGGTGNRRLAVQRC